MMSFKFFVLKEKNVEHNISIQKYNFLAARNWCAENCKGEWDISTPVYVNSRITAYRFAFENIHDATMFKLIWGE